ncbi:hypothetical protein Nepgr_016078 [Nepenthes gracilis]|uniref:PWWP domain-containing protein n=1 Tax=Nepenthes gracilis TaxID=150966 RepID=A0AAD3SPE6_NEPGR|nr:hypothetical protein Nepgr_016078 [Nepenthes gracilis]
MGSSSSEQQNTKEIDATVGGLVWIRRRNGSWWPGQIMGLDEISDSRLASPKAGTPIKLLGRDDATVDWYNLEKSRRVKAFRCGEYNDCIEKAKASAANSSKKVVKYARRENAILRALELESAHESKDYSNFSPKDDSDSIPCGNQPKASPCTSDRSKDSDFMSKETGSFVENSSSLQELSHSGISYEETNTGSALEGKPTKGRHTTLNDSEDEGSDGIKRMRGLDDLCVGSDRKVEDQGSLDAAPQGGASLNTLHVANCMPSSISLKRKRSRVVHIHEFLKRKHRQRTLTSVLNSLVTVPVMFDEFAYQNGQFCGLESNELKSSLSMIKNLESAGVSFENGNALANSCDTAPRGKLRDGETSGRTELPDTDSIENLIDVPIFIDDPLSGCSPAFVSSPSLRPHTAAFVGLSAQNCKAEASFSGDEALNGFSSTSLATAHIDNIAQKMDRRPSKWQLKGKRNSRHSTKARAPNSRKHLDEENEPNVLMSCIDPDDQIKGRNMRLSIRDIDIVRSTDEKHMLDRCCTYRKSLLYHHSRFKLHSKFEIPEASVGPYGDSVLYDVPVEVETGSRPRHVPYISLMSKWNGKAIMGHPIAVEVLGDWFVDPLIDAVECQPNNSRHEPDDDDAEGKGPPTKNPISKSHLSPSKSPEKRKKGSSSKKTRKLSSLTASHKLTFEERKPMVRNFKGPAIACIPLKVVFSRINEALNGSTRSIHRPPLNPK